MARKIEAVGALLQELPTFLLFFLRNTIKSIAFLGGKLEVKNAMILVNKSSKYTEQEKNLVGVRKSSMMC